MNSRQMLNYAGRSPGELTALDLNRLIQENIHFFSASITKTVAFHHDLAPELPEILGDRGQIQQLIMNLLLNAADAIGEQTGNITMSTTVRSINSSIFSSSRPLSGSAVPDCLWTNYSSVRFVSLLLQVSPSQWLLS